MVETLRQPSDSSTRCRLACCLRMLGMRGVLPTAKVPNLIARCRPKRDPIAGVHTFTRIGGSAL
jgi:hypothetical protein